MIYYCVPILFKLLRWCLNFCIVLELFTPVLFNLLLYYYIIMYVFLSAYFHCDISISRQGLLRSFFFFINIHIERMEHSWFNFFVCKVLVCNTWINSSMRFSPINLLSSVRSNSAHYIFMNHKSFLYFDITITLWFDYHFFDVYQ